MVEEQGYSEATLKTAIRKSLVGEAAQHLRNHGAADVADITQALELHYGEVMYQTTTWQDFYSVKQRRLESATSWRIRLEKSCVGLRAKKMEVEAINYVHSGGRRSTPNFEDSY